MARHYRGRHVRRRHQLAAPLLACAAILSGLLLSFPDATATNSTLNVLPSADAYVSQVQPTANFGSAKDLRTNGSPRIRRSYLRFDLATVSGGIVRATLRLYSKAGNAINYEVRAVPDPTWREETITYRTAPLPGPLVATAKAVRPGMFTSVDVTPLVTGGRSVDLVVTTADAAGLRFSSRESGELAPQLVVETSWTSTREGTATTKASSSTTRALTSTTSATTSTTRAPTSTSSSTTTSSTTTTTHPSGGWVNVVNDRFDSGGVPEHWYVYDGRYGSDPFNYARRDHVFVGGGVLHLLMKYEQSGADGAAWYTGGMQVKSVYAGVHQRVTLRWRVVVTNEQVHGGRVIPMRWVDDPAFAWYQGEADYFEGGSLDGGSTHLRHTDSSSVVSHDWTVNLRQWHTMRFETFPSGGGRIIFNAYIDDLTTPSWTYVGTEQTIPSAIRHTVLQQGCRMSGCPPPGPDTEDIQIDWITIDNLA
jgi:hypothetical protein